MSNFSKVVIVILIVLSFLFIREKYGSNISGFISEISDIHIEWPFGNKSGSKFPIKVMEPPKSIPVREAVEIEQPGTTADKSTVEIFFLALDGRNNSVYKTVQREVPPNENPFEFSIKSLLKGPNLVEKSLGAYSEIPASTKLLGIKQINNKIIIDFSSDFGYGGGTDSIYSRMMQLIKTAVANTENKKIYLYLDGQQVNMIGGEGIMISQPLTEKSLEI